MPRKSHNRTTLKTQGRAFEPQYNHSHPEESVQSLNPKEFAGHLSQTTSSQPISRISFALHHLAPIEGSTVLDPPRIMFGIEGRFPVIYSSLDKTQVTELSPGEMIFVSSKSWTRPLWEPSACKVGNIVFDQTFTRFTIREWNGNPSSPSSNRFFHSSTPFGGVIKHIVSALELQSFSNGEPNDATRLLIQALFFELQSRLEHMASESRPKEERGLAASTWRAIASYVEEHYHEPINLMDVARFFSMNADHISRLFRTVGGENFNKFITRLRMGKSEYLLRNYQLSIEDVAIQCGYTDAGYFRKVFNKHFGLTPNQFRRSLAGQQKT